MIMSLKLDGLSPRGKSDFQNSLKPLVAVSPSTGHTSCNLLIFTSKLVEGSTFLTLEALVLSVAKLVIHVLGYLKVAVSAQKPNAYALVERPGVKIIRDRSEI